MTAPAPPPRCDRSTFSQHMRARCARVRGVYFANYGNTDAAARCEWSTFPEHMGPHCAAVGYCAETMRIAVAATLNSDVINMYEQHVYADVSQDKAWMWDSHAGWCELHCCKR